MQTLTLFALFASLFLVYTVSAAPNPKVVKIGTFGKKTLFASAEDKGFEWEQAKAFCSQNGFKLASIQSQAESDAVGKFVLSKAQGGADVYHGWLGGTDLAKDGVWEWVSGDAFQFKNWESQPTTNDENNCAYIKTSGKWSASYCFLPHRAVCQKVAAY